jgi:hypothetical protein
MTAVSEIPIEAVADSGGRIAGALAAAVVQAWDIFAKDFSWIWANDGPMKSCKVHHIAAGAIKWAKDDLSGHGHFDVVVGDADIVAGRRKRVVPKTKC